MNCTLKTACLAVACLAISSHAEATKDNEDVDITSEGFDYHLYARNALEKDAAAIKAEFGDDVDTSLDGYEHLLFARKEAGADDEVNAQSDAEIAAEHAKSLAEDDEDYDAIPDGVDDAEYQKDLDENNAEDNDLPLDRREADPKLVLPPKKFLFAPTPAEKKRLGRMKPHYVKHEDTISADLKKFMRRFADDPESGDEDVDVGLEEYDHELVRRESGDVDDGDNEWEEPQEELKGYDHSKLLQNDDSTPEEQAKYLQEYNKVVARDFEELEDENDEGDNDRYAAPEDTKGGSLLKRGYTLLQELRKGVKVEPVEKPGYTPLQKLRKGVKVEPVEKRGYTPLQKLRKGVKVLLGYENHA